MKIKTRLNGVGRLDEVDEIYQRAFARYNHIIPRPHPITQTEVLRDIIDRDYPVLRDTRAPRNQAQIIILHRGSLWKRFWRRVSRLAWKIGG